MRSTLLCVFVLAAGLAGCTESPLAIDPEDMVSPSATPEALIDAAVLSVSASGQALAPQSLSMQLFVQPDSIYRRFVNGPRLDYLHPGETLQVGGLSA